MLRTRGLSRLLPSRVAALRGECIVEVAAGWPKLERRWLEAHPAAREEDVADVEAGSTAAAGTDPAAASWHAGMLAALAPTFARAAEAAPMPPVSTALARGDGRARTLVKGLLHLASCGPARRARLLDKVETRSDC